MDQQKIADLIEKYNNGQCDEREKALLETWYAGWNLDMMPHIADESIKEDLLLNREKALERVRLSTPDHSYWSRIAVAAMILIMASIGIFYFASQKDDAPQSMAYANDIAPGSIGATLTLANGKKIRLTNASNGELANESGVTITKTADGQIVYLVSDVSPADSGKINTLSTTKGETYRVRLPDHTEVWLNAASVLRYPASFKRTKSRRVELEGEAYFEVAKNIKQPFLVKTDKQIVKVLGTHFNVKAYADESVERTTLVEGSVQVSDHITSKMLKPGQQASLLKQGQFEISPSDEVLNMAWKNNEFMFESEPIENVMKMVERWYNVEVIYVGEKPADKFGGGVSRFEKVSKVLELLERTGDVHFKIENRKIFVMKSR